MLYEYFAEFRKLHLHRRVWRPLDVYTRKVLNEDTKYWCSLGLSVYLHRHQIWVRKKK